MTCQQLIEFLTEYVDGQLPLSDREAFDLHLAICRDCRSYLHNFKTTIAATKTAVCQLPVDAPAELPEGLVAAILEARRKS